MKYGNRETSTTRKWDIHPPPISNDCFKSSTNANLIPIYIIVPSGAIQYMIITPTGTKYHHLVSIWCYILIQNCS